MMTRWGDGMGEPPPYKPHGDEDPKRRQEAVNEGGKTTATKQAA